MVNRNDAASDALLQRVIEYLRRQEIPEFPDPEIAVAKIAAEHPSSVRSISPLRRIIMNRRFQLSAGVIVSTAALLGFLLLWGGSATQPVSAMENAMEKMAESMQKAKSYKYTQTLRETLSPEPGKPPHTQVETETGYWRTPGSKRFEIETVPDPDGKGRQELLILPAGRPGIVADHGRKVFIRGTAGADESLTMPDVELVWELKNLGKFSGKPDRELGTKEIAGRKARGFEIDNKRLDPVLTPGLFLWGRAPVQIWLDDESSLPILCSRDVGTTGSITTQIQWNVDLDPKLFDPTPPEGYTDITPKAPTSETELSQISSRSSGEI